MPSGATYDVGNNIVDLPDQTLLLSTQSGLHALKAKIVSGATTAVEVGSDSEVSNVAIEQKGGSTALALTGPGAWADSVNVVTSAPTACELGDGARINDAFCVSNSAAGAAVKMSGTGAAIIRGVTAVATGPSGFGIETRAENPGDSISIDARNAIFSGEAVDARASAVTGATATLLLDHSNFATTDESPTGTTSISSPDAPNQSAEPIFADAAEGDYHEDPSSPTVDAGYWDDLTLPADIDGEARAFGAPLDIGADEVIDEISPVTKITRAPKKTTHSRTATFRFKTDDPTATRYCRLDHSIPVGGVTCSSPFTLRHLRTGRHRLEIRTLDEHQNGTYTYYHWSIVPKKGEPPDGPRLANCGSIDVPGDTRDAVILAHQVGCKVARKVGRYWVGSGPKQPGWACWSDRCYKGDRGSSQWIKSRWAKARRD